MSDALAPSFVRDLLATAWPPVQSSDSELLRRRKLAIRGGQLAMVSLIVAAVLATFVPHAGQASPIRIVALICAALCYIAWSVFGLREPVRHLIATEGAGVRGPRREIAGWRLAVYFAVQFTLAELLYVLADRGRVTAVMWLVLLPPVAHSVILLRPRGIALVCGITVVMFIGNMVRWSTWDLIQNAALAFLFSVLFTVVFTLLAVTSERSRQQVEQLAADLTEANAKLREYAVQVEELAATRERNRLAREIHDSLGHYLTVVNVQVEAALAVQEQAPAQATEALKKAQMMTRQGLKEVRQSVASLRASPLDQQTLAQAVQQCVADTLASGVRVEVEIRGKERVLSPQAQLTFYRAAQEGLTNLRKHSQATTGRLLLDFSDPTRTRFELSDNGRGSTSAEGGFGLLGLRERVALLNGTFLVRTAPGAGFAIRIEVPA